MKTAMILMLAGLALAGCSGEPKLKNPCERPGMSFLPASEDCAPLQPVNQNMEIIVGPGADENRSQL